MAIATTYGMGAKHERICIFRRPTKQILATHPMGAGRHQHRPLRHAVRHCLFRERVDSTNHATINNPQTTQARKGVEG